MGWEQVRKRLEADEPRLARLSADIDRETPYRTRVNRLEGSYDILYPNEDNAYGDISDVDGVWIRSLDDFSDDPVTSLRWAKATAYPELIDAAADEDIPVYMGDPGLQVNAKDLLKVNDGFKAASLAAGLGLEAVALTGFHHGLGGEVIAGAAAGSLICAVPMMSPHNLYDFVVHSGRDAILTYKQQTLLEETDAAMFATATTRDYHVEQYILSTPQSKLDAVNGRWRRFLVNQFHNEDTVPTTVKLEHDGRHWEEVEQFTADELAAVVAQ